MCEAAEEHCGCAAPQRGGVEGSGGNTHEVALTAAASILWPAAGSYSMLLSCCLVLLLQLFERQNLPKLNVEAVTLPVKGTDGGGVLGQREHLGLQLLAVPHLYL